MVCAYNPSTGELEAGGAGGMLGQRETDSGKHPRRGGQEEGRKAELAMQEVS